MSTAILPKLSGARISLEEYLHSSYEPDCDFVEGLLEERNLGEYEHSIVQALTTTWFVNRRREWRIRVATEYRTRVSDTRVRIPDVSIFADDGRVEKVRVTAPILCIEILSPEDRLARVLRVMNDFLAMGVKNVWLLDPIERVAFTYTGVGLRLVDGPRVSVAESPMYLDLPEIFGALD